MRRRRFRGKGGVAAWRAKHWTMTGVFLPNALTPSVSGLFSIPLLAQPDYDPVGAGQERITSLRIVGDVNIIPEEPTTASLCLAVIEADEQNGVLAWPLVANTNTDPGDPDFYVSQRILWCGCGFLNTSGEFSPYREHLDIRVKSKLESGRGIFLVGSLADTVTGDGVAGLILMNIRNLYAD